MARRYINDVGGKYEVTLKDDAGKRVATLIWGDPVRVIKKQGDMTKVFARARTGWVPSTALTDDGLLEVFVIDVGQGDGVLMRTPDDKWHLIDAGVSNARQMLGKGAANFLRWKFIDELEMDAVALESVIVTHPDFDHYGGIIDLFNGKVQRPDRTFDVSVERFYHSGMGRFADDPPLGATTPGAVSAPPIDGFGVDTDGEFITELLGGKGSFKSPVRPFEKSFAEYAKLVGKVPKSVQRLSQRDGHVPDYDGSGGGVALHVLGPIVEQVDGTTPGLRVLGSESVTRNGHSIVLRADYGQARILLTGDLNTASQRLLLAHHQATEFTCDVAKGCHHGSDDVDLRFVRAMGARATVVSSGDNESYAHPRPRVLGASARYGRESRHVKGGTLPPLLYSTELARSVTFAFPEAVRRESEDAILVKAADAEVRTDGKHKGYMPLDEAPVATDLVYGLITIRTDGTRVMCAYMKEAGSQFDLQVFQAGVAP